MLLTANNLVYYLLDRGFVAPDSVVDGDFLVVDATRRNRNFKVIRRHAPSYFVKQVKTWDAQAVASLQTEANCYWLARSDPDFAPLAPLVPAFHGYDPARNILVMELLPAGENLTEYHRRLGAFPPPVAAQLGRLLGTYHREIGARLPRSPHKAGFPQRVPWILSAHEIPGHPAYGHSQANSQVLGIIQRYPEFQQGLDRLRARWQPTSLIHGDIKWDNCVVTGQHAEGTLDLKIVDWELADVGDAYWDAGAMFQNYLTFWIYSMPVTGDMTPAQFMELAQYPLEAMQPAMQAFWAAYVAAQQAPAAATRELLERSVQYGAARMIQTAYEYMYYAPQISTNTICLLQVSLNILENPREAIQYLLGM